MKLINLTPHTITLVGVEGAITVAPSGDVARLAVTRVELAPVLVDGVALSVSRPSKGPVTGLPPESDGVLYIVSAMVAESVRRRDVVSPGELIRDGAGVVTGAKWLWSYVGAKGVYSYSPV